MPVEAVRKSIHLRRAPKGGLARYKGGQWIDTDLWQAEKQKAKDALPGVLAQFGQRLQFLRLVYEQNAALQREGVTKVALVPLTVMEAQMKQAVREAYSRAFLLGKKAAGNLTSATEEEQRAVKRLRLDEYQYLCGFLGDMRAERGVMDYSQRMSMYQMAARELFWLGFVLGNTRPGRVLTWHTGPSEHCEDCARFAAHGPYPVQEFLRDVLGNGYLPQSGKLACLGFHCQCWLEAQSTTQGA